MRVGSVSRESVTERIDVLLYREKPTNQLALFCLPAGAIWIRNFVALHRTIAERNAKILYRGTEIGSYNEPKALAERC
jgi:hypothetical protein